MSSCTNLSQTNRITNEAFPKPDAGPGRPLPEDFVMRGQLWSNNYFPNTWFKAKTKSSHRTRHAVNSDLSYRHDEESTSLASQRANGPRSGFFRSQHELSEFKDRAAQGSARQQQPSDYKHPDYPESTGGQTDFDTWTEEEPKILLQPETRPISHEELAAEVKGIYAGLVMVEAKCIEIDRRHSAAAQDINPARQSHLTTEQWEALIALHKTLLHEHHDFFLASQHPSASSALSRPTTKHSMPPFEAPKLGTRVRHQTSKIKRGLSGFVNGFRKSALPDTGAKHNFMSANYAKEAGLKVEVSPSLIKIGNSKKIQSIGTTNMLWAFAENPAETFNIICHVLRQCTYDLILGSGFLTATETMSKHRRRITECIFSVFNVFHFSFLDNNYQFLEGTLGDTQTVHASPDTGAERNVMDMQYAVDHGFNIHAGPEHCNYLQFADGSDQETVGQVSTHWTFASGERIPITFEILENCCSNVILGGDFLWDYNVFEDHETSIVTLSFESDSIELAPFSFHKKWQKGWNKVLTKLKYRTNSSNTPKQNPSYLETLHAEERRLRNIWNHDYGFGGSETTTAEREIERNRRRRYEAEVLRIQALSNSGNNSGNNIPIIPSIPTSPDHQIHQHFDQPP